MRTTDQEGLLFGLHTSPPPPPLRNKIEMRLFPFFSLSFSLLATASARPYLSATERRTSIYGWVAFSLDIPEGEKREKETLPKRKIVVVATALKLTPQLLPFFFLYRVGRGDVRGALLECHEWSFNIGRKKKKGGGGRRRTKHTRCQGMSNGGGERKKKKEFL